MAVAYVLIKTELGREKEIIDNLNKIENVKYAQGTLGDYDVVTMVEISTESELKKTVAQNIRKIGGIRYTLTLLEVQPQGHEERLKEG